MPPRLPPPPGQQHPLPYRTDGPFPPPPQRFMHPPPLMGGPAPPPNMPPPNIRPPNMPPPSIPRALANRGPPPSIHYPSQDPHRMGTAGKDPAMNLTPPNPAS